MGPRWAPKGFKMSPRWHKMGPKWRPKGEDRSFLRHLKRKRRDVEKMTPLQQKMLTFSTGRRPREAQDGPKLAPSWAKMGSRSELDFIFEEKMTS